MTLSAAMERFTAMYEAEIGGVRFSPLPAYAIGAAEEPPSGGRRPTVRSATVFCMAGAIAADRRRARGVPGRIILKAVPAVGVGESSSPRTSGSTPREAASSCGRVSPYHWPARLIHILAGAVALLVGPAQFLPAVRRHRRLHRTLGRSRCRPRCR